MYLEMRAGGRYDTRLGSLRTSNTRGIVARFYQAERSVQDAIRRVVRSSGFRQQGSAKRKAPVRTGRLRRLIRLEFSPDRYSYTVGWKEEDFAKEDVPFYPLYTEFGTIRMRPRPCLFPARDEEIPRFREDLRRAISEALRRSRR